MAKPKTVTQMKPKNKLKFVRLGTVLNGKNGPCLKLGNDYGDEAYHYTVDVTVRNAAGEVVAEQTNGFVNFYDPRVQEGRKVPDSVAFEASIGIPLVD